LRRLITVIRSLPWLAAVLALQLAGASQARAAPDPLLRDQWALGAGGVGAPAAWTQSLGDGVVVAVLDSGMQLDHPDLAANIWTNLGEVPANGVDDDHNGFVDDVHGADILDGDGEVGDDLGHGTHVAGIVAALAGNGVGGAGLAPRAQIMPVKIFDAHNGGNAELLARGIRYAVAEGARVINVSATCTETSRGLDAAIAEAEADDVTIVAAAGNDGLDLDLRPVYPAASTSSAVLSVTATGERGGLTGFANRGLRSVDLAAPGSHILSTATGSRFEQRSGTSMAAPFVSAALALLAAARPDLGQARLREVLRDSAGKPQSLLALLGGGTLDAGAAMHEILPGKRWRETPVALPAVTPLAVRLSGARKVRAGGRATVRWPATRGVATWTIYLDGRRAATRSSHDSHVLHRRFERPGAHRWKVVGRDGRGVRIVVASRPFRVLGAH
jgi:subtilisin family serine protease